MYNVVPKMGYVEVCDFTYNLQISDFGLAKWLPEKWAHHVVFPIEGTFGLSISFNDLLEAFLISKVYSHLGLQIFL